MHEKDFHISELLDLYGVMLSDQRRQMLEDYYNNDFSLSEIAENAGISRQGVHFLIKKGETELHDMEDKLHLYQRLNELSGQIRTAQRQLHSLRDEMHDASVCARITEITEQLGALSDHLLH